MWAAYPSGSLNVERHNEQKYRKVKESKFKTKHKKKDITPSQLI